MPNSNILEPEVLYYGATGVSTISGPLKKLETNPFRTSTLSYPRNLGSSTRKHVIEFVTRVPDPSFSPTADVTNQVVKVAEDTANLLTTSIPRLITGKANTEQTLTELSNFGGNLSQSAGSAFSTLSTADVKRINGTTIRLYVPDTVNVQYGAIYDKIELAGVLGKPYFLAQAGVSLYEKYKQAGGTGAGAKGLINAVGDDPYVRSLIGDLVAPGAGAILAAGVGQALNPQLQVLFSGVDFRTFQFDFTLTPYSQEEAVAIKNIVKEFKKAAAPQIQPAAVFGQGLFYKVPHRFKIKFLYNGVENTNVHKLTECVLENINIDYAPMGWATFGDGNPVQTRMTLQFKEVEIVDRTRIEQGY